MCIHVYFFTNNILIFTTNNNNSGILNHIKNIINVIKLNFKYNNYNKK